MTRCRTWIAITALLIVASALAIAATPDNAEAATTLRARLRHARHELTQARNDLAASQAALDAALAGTTTTEAATPTPTTSPTSTSTPTPDPTGTIAAEPTPSPSPTATDPTVDELQADVASAKRTVKRLSAKVRRLARAYRLQQRLAACERRGQWRPIIRYAAARYHVSPGGIYHMMRLESGGRRFAGASSPYKGLFQYCTGTWRSGWNPWRHESIFDGSAQIFATCLAVHRGYGPHMWPNTYPASF